MVRNRRRNVPGRDWIPPVTVLRSVLLCLLADALASDAGIPMAEALSIWECALAWLKMEIR